MWNLPVTDLLLRYTKYVVTSGVEKTGCLTFVTKRAVVACFLHFYKAVIEQKSLYVLFGVPPSTISQVLQRAEQALDEVLALLSDVRVR